MLRAVRELRRAARSSSPRTMRVKAQLGASFGSTASVGPFYSTKFVIERASERLKLFDLRRQSVSQSVISRSRPALTPQTCVPRFHSD